MQSLLRALRILHEVGQSNTGVTLQEVSDRLEIPLASAYRLLSTLLDQGFLVRSATTKRYFIGPAAVALSTSAIRARHLFQVPPGPVARAALATGETVFLAELVGNTAMCVAIASGRRNIRLFAQLGGELPLHAAAAARALLVDYEDDEICHILGQTELQPFTARTPSRPEDVLASIRRVRARGFDTCVDELDEGVSAIAVPMCFGPGRLYSVTVAAPTRRMRRASVRNMAAQALLVAARELRHDLVKSPGPDAAARRSAHRLKCRDS